MKQWWLAAPLSVVLLLLTAGPSDAWRGHHGHHWHGGPRVFLGFGFAPWWYPAWYYPPPYYAYSPTVVVQQPPVYIEQQTPMAPAPPVASAPPAQPQYWYYCQPSGAYYPSVATCTEPWIKVPPRTQ